MIPVLNVQSAAPWHSYSSPTEAIAAGEKDRAETMSSLDVSLAVGSTICDICWNEKYVTFHFSNEHWITLAATQKGIVLSSKKIGLQEPVIPESVFLSFKTLPEAAHWDRAAILEERQGTIFRGLQLSGHTAFAYTSGSEALMLSILEVMCEDGQTRLILYWHDAS